MRASGIAGATSTQRPTRFWRTATRLPNYVISCLPDEPRYIGDQDVLVLQDKVIEHILAADREAEAKATARSEQSIWRLAQVAEDVKVMVAQLGTGVVA